jgi:hypothetical protein
VPGTSRRTRSSSGSTGSPNCWRPNALAAALHSGDPAFEGLPGYFLQRLGPTLAELLDAAVADGAVRDDISAEDLLHAITALCQPVPGRAPEDNQRIVAVLLDGLRRGATQRPRTR